MRKIAVLIIAGAVALGGAAAPAGTTASLRERLLATPISSELGGAGTRPVASGNAFTFPMPNSPRQHQRPFSFGNRLFNTNWVTAPGSVTGFDGLGPLFNRVSCSGCHTHDGRGAPPADGEGPFDTMLIRLSVPGESTHGGPAPHPTYGDQLSERAIHGVPPEGRARISYEDIEGRYGDGTSYTLRKPSYSITELGYGPLGKDIMISPRVAPHMIGLGLLQAVPDTTLTALADPEDADTDGISGRVNIVWDQAKQSHSIGRFGWKANQPNLAQQNAAAAHGDIGLTTSLNPTQSCSGGQNACSHAPDGGSPEVSDYFMKKLTLYTMTIAVPQQRKASDPEVKRGEELFGQFGCAACHMPTLVTGQHSEFSEVSHQTIHPFSDLLLHDMGAGLADKRPDFEATGAEWRTPPLWGLGLIPTINGHNTLLHDGRARGFAEAILWHGGEAEAAKEAFRSAPRADRDALVAFLNSL